MTFNLGTNLQANFLDNSQFDVYYLMDRETSLMLFLLFLILP